MQKRRRSAAVAGVIVAITLTMLFARRPDQFLHPYIWVEDGFYTLGFVARDGGWTIIEPLNGYLIVAPKIISYAAYKISLVWAPNIQIMLTSALTCAAVLAIAFSPTHLRWPFVCAVAALLVPIDAEVFAVGAYACWWAGLLLPLALLWDSDRGREPLRWLYIIGGGLSSPRCRANCRFAVAACGRRATAGGPVRGGAGHASQCGAGRSDALSADRDPLGHDQSSGRGRGAATVLWRFLPRADVTARVLGDGRHAWVCSMDRTRKA
jgi:hypothetical protein